MWQNIYYASSKIFTTRPFASKIFASPTLCVYPVPLGFSHSFLIPSFLIFLQDPAQMGKQSLSNYLLAQACLALFIGLACSAAHAAAIIGWRAAAGSIQLIDVLMAQCTAPHFLRLAGAECRLLTPGQVSVWSSSSSAAVSPCSSSQPFSCSPPPCTTLLPWRSKFISSQKVPNNVDLL